jgi:mRNA interferase RelE/StbE
VTLWPTPYVVSLTQEAKDMLAAIGDRRVRKIIASRISELEEDPESQGKPLTGELQGYRSVRAVGQRYRIIYKVGQKHPTVDVVSLGPRKEGDKKDVYSLTQKLARKGKLGK